jgi:hypothetical protein
MDILRKTGGGVAGVQERHDERASSCQLAPREKNNRNEKDEQTQKKNSKRWVAKHTTTTTTTTTTHVLADALLVP